MKDKTLPELLVELERSTINGKSMVNDISWEQAVELRLFFSSINDCFFHIVSYINEPDTYDLLLYKV